ncbi:MULTISPECIES: hypothetical protein [Pseudomonas]|uniref:hypothetical protein n=1 Tax=Pseudomonas nitroreducens TaxID=46680 RepID=UPI001E379C6C|nr:MULTISPECIES: hypothetical protein [Pseudomonas]MCE4073519.1 hypothetical protein [Pseudomonas nitritireducens]MCE4079758.1 hypothetical protein [Pseudomonas nitroreducens]
MKFQNLPVAEVTKILHQETVVLKAIETLNLMRLDFCLPPLGLDLKAPAKPSDQVAEDVPPVRDVVRLIGLLGKAIAVSEEIAREGNGGIVRIQALAPVVAAIQDYLACLPSATVAER